MPGKPAVFLDRDGTLNEEKGYINHLSRFELLPGAAAAIGLLNRCGVPAVLVTNQAGAARGHFPESLIGEVHQLMCGLLAQQGARLDGLYLCTHHPEDGCGCRKPQADLLRRAAAELNLDLGRSYMVGDRWSDLEAAAGCGATPVLVLTGYGRGELAHTAPRRQVQPRHVAADIEAAVTWILRDLGLRLP